MGFINTCKCGNIIFGSGTRCKKCEAEHQQHQKNLGTAGKVGGGIFGTIAAILAGLKTLDDTTGGKADNEYSRK